MALFGPRRQAPPPSEPQPEPTPPSITKDDIVAAVTAAVGGVRADLDTKIAELRGALDASRSQPVVIQQQAPAAPTAPIITDDDIDNAISQGPGAGRAVRTLVESALDRVNKAVDERIAAVTNTGLSSLAGLTREVVLSKLPKYPKFKKEIDEQIAKLPPAAQADAQTVQIVYNAVLGMHAEEIEQAAREEAIRQAQAGDLPAGDTPPARGNSGNTPGATGRGTSKGVPTLEEFAGTEGVEALKHKDRRSGNDQDSLAQSMGYDNWAHYMDVYEKTKKDAETIGVTTS